MFSRVNRPGFFEGEIQVLSREIRVYIVFSESRRVFSGFFEGEIQVLSREIRVKM